MVIAKENGSTPPANAFVRVARKVYHPLGFRKGYNFVLFFIFAGALTGFALARFMYLNFNIFCPATPAGSNSAIPGECYWYESFSRYKIGIVMHLATILPAGLLVVLQFVPAIRYRAILFHRLNGYVVILLALISLGAALAITDRAFGGSLTTQTALGLLAFSSAGALIMAYVNVKCLQIEQHRAWMLRAWFWMASIITLRIVGLIAVAIISSFPDDRALFMTYPCEVLRSIVKDDGAVADRYPSCGAASDPSPLPLVRQAAVRANLNGDFPEQASSALLAGFNMSTWFAFALHVVGVEFYLKFTPREAERLRQLSYRKQLERGWKNPGSVGLVVERFGDADPWEKPVEEDAKKTGV